MKIQRIQRFNRKRLEGIPGEQGSGRLVLRLPYQDLVILKLGQNDHHVEFFHFTWTLKSCFERPSDGMKWYREQLEDRGFRFGKTIVRFLSRPSPLSGPPEKNALSPEDQKKKKKKKGGGEKEKKKKEERGGGGGLALTG